MNADAPTPKVYGFFGLLWRLALAGALTFGVAAAGSYVAVERLVRRGEVQAPDLLTLPLEKALNKASSEGHPLLVEAREKSDLLEPGGVLSQRPQPGTWVKEGAVLRVTVALKP
jgi:beta-lactam-binding protein with PASTA domain